MTSRHVKVLATTFLLLIGIPPSFPMRRCASNSFFNRDTGLCQECIPFCPVGTKMEKPCKKNTNTVCTPVPSGCASGWYLDGRQGRCQECTRFCNASLAVLSPCTQDADMVCGVRTEQPPKPRENVSTEQSKGTRLQLSPGATPSPNPPATTHRVLKEITKVETNPKSDQPISTARMNLPPNLTEKTPENVPTGVSKQETTIFSKDEDASTLSTVGLALQGDRALSRLTSPSGGEVLPSRQRQPADYTKFYLLISISSVLASVTVVVVAVLGIYCTRLKCRDRQRRKGVAGSSKRPTETNNRDDGSSLNNRLADPSSFHRPSPPFCSTNRGSHPTASLAVEDESAEVESCACAASTDARHLRTRWSYEDCGYYHGRPETPSLSNSYPPLRPPMMPSRVQLRADGTTEAQLAHYACGTRPRSVCSDRHCCHERIGSVEVAYHAMPRSIPSCSVSDFSVVSGSSEYSV